MVISSSFLTSVLRQLFRRSGLVTVKIVPRHYTPFMNSHPRWDHWIFRSTQGRHQRSRLKSFTSLFSLEDASVRSPYVVWPPWEVAKSTARSLECFCIRGINGYSCEFLFLTSVFPSRSDQLPFSGLHRKLTPHYSLETYASPISPLFSR